MRANVAIKRYSISFLQNFILNEVKKHYNLKKTIKSEDIIGVKGRTHFISRLSIDTNSIIDILSYMYSYRYKEELKNTSELLYLLFNKNFAKVPKCKNCKTNNCNFRGINRGYTKFCGNTCRYNFETKSKIIETKPNTIDLEDKSIKINTKDTYEEFAEEYENLPSETQMKKKVEKKRNLKKRNIKRIKASIDKNGDIYIQKLNVEKFKELLTSNPDDVEWHVNVRCTKCKKNYTVTSTNSDFKCLWCLEEEKKKTIDTYVSTALDAKDNTKPPSKSETEIYNFVLGITDEPISRQNRTMIAPKEIDIVCESTNPRIGIEYDSNIYHSEKENVGKYYHRDKSHRAIENNIYLMNFWGDYWERSDTSNGKQKIKKIIMMAFGYVPKKFYGKKPIDHKVVRYGILSDELGHRFFKENHVDENRTFNRYPNLMFYGAYNKSNKLISSFAIDCDTKDFNKLVEMKVVRWVNHLDNYEPIKITFDNFCTHINNSCKKQNVKIQYLLDLRHDNIFDYYEIGMKVFEEIEPEFRYLQINKHRSYEHDIITEENINEHINDYDSKQTITENLERCKKFTKFWDCGKMLMEKNYEKNTYAKKPRSQDQLF